MIAIFGDVFFSKKSAIKLFVQVKFVQLFTTLKNLLSAARTIRSPILTLLRSDIERTKDQNIKLLKTKTKAKQ